MRGHGPAGLLLLVPALLVVLAADHVWPRIRAAGGAVARWPPLARLHGRVGRLPVMVALPLFIIPEACSRLGWVVSAWLVLQGDPWRALAIYAATKLTAGSLALWICSACLPVLLRVRAFAAGHAMLMRSRHAMLGWARQREGGPFAAAVARLRAGRLRVRSSTAAPAPATPSAPTDRSPTG